MKIYYIAAGRIPGEKASSIQTLKMYKKIGNKARKKILQKFNNDTVAKKIADFLVSVTDLK
jgi:hypothetical protein